MERLEIDEELVRSLVREQHPDLAGLEIRAVDGRWDNQLWRLGDELAVRIPCTERAPGLLLNEYRWMPVLAPRLPLPVGPSTRPTRWRASSKRFTSAHPPRRPPIRTVEFRSAH